MRLLTKTMSRVATARTRALAAAALLGISAAAHAAVIAHWSFDSTLGPKNAYQDNVGGHTATPADPNSVKPFDGDAPFGKAVFFNGSKESFLTTPALNNIQKTSFTVTAWVYLTKTHANFIITDWKVTGDAAWVFGVDLPKANVLKNMPMADLRSPDLDPSPTRKGIHMPVARYAEQKKDLALNQWHHLAWTWNRSPGVLTAYLDGEEIGSAKQSHTPLDLTPAKNAVRIGGREASNFNMDGAIDELWIFNEALNPEQIRNMMRYNNLGGTGELAAVMLKKPDGTITLAKSAPPSAAAPAPHPAASPRQPRPPAGGGGTAVASGNRPAPPDPTPAARSDSENAGATSVAASPDPPPMTTADEEPPEVVVQSMTSDMPKVVAVVPSRYTPGRVAGILSCSLLSLLLGGYMFWAMNERSKMRVSR